MKILRWLAVLLIMLGAGCRAPSSAIPTSAPAGVQALEPPIAPHAWSAPTSTLTNEVYDGLVYSADLDLAWSHADPPAVEYYEVWHAVNEPYFEPGTCVSCTMVITSTALSEIVPAPGQTFVPDWDNRDDPRFNWVSDFDFYIVRAVNRAGASASSNRIGVITYSLKQRVETLPVPGG